MSLTGQEFLQVTGVQANGQPSGQSFQTTVGAIAQLASEDGSLVETAITTAGAGTLTAAALIGGQILRTGPVAAYTDTLDTAANIVTALGAFTSGQTFIVRIKNATAYVQTLATASGITLPATVINAPYSSYQMFGTIGGTAASPTVTFTHIASVPLANSITQGSAITTALTTVGAGTITAAGIVGGITVRTGPTAAFTDTTDTAANIIAAQPGLVNKIGTSFTYYYQNSTPFLATLAGSTGVTVSGITTVPSNMAVEYLVTYTAAATITMVGVGIASGISTGLALSGSVSGQTLVVPAATSGYTTVTFPGNTTTLAGLNTAQTFTAVQTFTNNDIKLLGSSTGGTVFTSSNAGASNFTVTVPPVTETLTLGQSAFSNTAITFVSSIALQQVPGLFVTLTTSGTYAIDCYLPVNTIAAAGGIAVAAVASNSLTATAFSVGLQLINTTSVGYAAATTSTLGNTMSSTTLCVLARLTGAINVNTGGILSIQAAQAGSSANTTTIAAGGYLNVTRILNNGV